MSPGHKLAWFLLGSFIGLGLAAGFDYRINRLIEEQLKNATKGVSQLSLD